MESRRGTAVILLAVAVAYLLNGCQETGTDAFLGSNEDPRMTAITTTPIPESTKSATSATISITNGMSSSTANILSNGTTTTVTDSVTSTSNINMTTTTSSTGTGSFTGNSTATIVIDNTSGADNSNSSTTTAVSVGSSSSTINSTATIVNDTIASTSNKSMTTTIRSTSASSSSSNDTATMITHGITSTITYSINATSTRSSTDTTSTTTTSMGSISSTTTSSITFTSTISSTSSTNSISHTTATTTTSFFQCLCVFDIDRTLTGKQGDVTRCPRNKVMAGVHDDAYGGGILTLSALAANGLSGTFCNSCYLGICSAGGAHGIGERPVLLEQFLRTPLQDALRLSVPNASVWSYSADFIGSPLVLGATNKQKQYDVEEIRQWYRQQGIEISRSRVFFYGDKLENIRPFAEMNFNARQVSCSSRDESHSKVGYCGALPEEILEVKGTVGCS